MQLLSLNVVNNRFDRDEKTPQLWSVVVGQAPDLFPRPT
jgi:hypothetical protein